MSQFDRYTETDRVEAMRVFLKVPKPGFQRALGLVKNPDEKRVGRLPGYREEGIREIERRTNEKSARAESSDTTMGDRILLARDFKGFSDGDIAKSPELAVTRELVRRWRENINRPPEARLAALAVVLDVPVAWLIHGGEATLPANSHLGVRVGEEAAIWRESLYSLELPVVAELSDDVDDSYAQAYMEHAVMTRPELAQAARRAGGRWQVVGGALYFSPWVPIAEHGLSRRFWSDEVEAIIEEELATKPSIYGAWHALKARCEALGLTAEQYPAKISLHKRVEKERARAIQFGVNLNPMIAQAIEQHPQLH